MCLLFVACFCVRIIVVVEPLRVKVHSHLASNFTSAFALNFNIVSIFRGGKRGHMHT